MAPLGNDPVTLDHGGLWTALNAVPDLRRFSDFWNDIIANASNSSIEQIGRILEHNALSDLPLFRLATSRKSPGIPLTATYSSRFINYMFFIDSLKYKILSICI